VINVTWDDAQRYVAWLSKMTGKPYRLLSEAEWEYAARAGSDKAYSWGDEIGKGNANCNVCGSKWDNMQTAPVGSFAANQFGLYDMAGSVWEWVEDCFNLSYEGWFEPMNLDHSENNNHSHVHAPKNFGFAFAVGTTLNLLLVAAQFIYGIHAQSIALIADAGHNLGDALGLALAWSAYVLAQKEPTERYTYGFRSASILAALSNAVILLVATGAIVWEAVRRFAEPPQVAAPTVMVVAAIAIAINLASAWLLRAGEHDLNIRSAFIHLLADAAVSLGVVAAGAVMLLTRWNWVDPAVSLVISGVIVWGTWGLLRDAVKLSLHAVPAGIELSEVRQYLEALPGVSGAHDLHVWAMSTTEVALSCHLVIPRGAPGDEFINEVCDELHRRFGIAHPTIQIETGDHACRLEPSHVV
jgi:cobalt-zinc-cadmium efflux system protein